MTHPAALVLDVRDLRTQVRSGRSVVRAVDGLSLRLRPGETLGLVGESGCGKTMTALSIMRLLPKGGLVESGQIVLDGVALTELTEPQMRAVRGADIGMIFQDPLSSLNPTMPVGAQVAEPVRLHRDASPREAGARAREMLDLVGLPDPGRQMRAFPHQLSGGMRQRVMIAMALACEPKLLIADEPTTGLDVTIQRQILDLIDRLKDRLGMAVILVTHDLGVIAGRADRVAVMYAGKIVEEADTTALFARHRHQYTGALFSALPERASGHGQRLYSIPGMPPDLAEPQAGCRFAPRCPAASSQCLGAEPAFVSGEDGHGFACLHPLGPVTEYGARRAASAAASVPLPSPGPPRAGPRPARALARPSGPSAEAPVDPPAGAQIQAAAGPGPAGSAEMLLEFDRVSKEYPATHGIRFGGSPAVVSAVHDVSFALRRGETLGLVGESGCGKSTIGRLIVGLERPGSGTVRFEGQEIHALRGERLRQARRHLQLMFQDSSAALDPRKRVQASLEEPLVIQGIGDRRDRGVRVRQLLSDVGLPAAAADRYPHEFSGGQRQRIGLARSIALNPRLVVADEPVSALDVSVQAQILNLMVELRQQYGLTYLLISHDLSVVRHLAATIAVMYLGNLVEIGPRDAVYYEPAHPYTRGLIDAVPVPDPVAERGKASAGIPGELPSPIRPPSGCRFRTRCPLAQEVCAVERPVLRRFGHPGHLAACHFPLRVPYGEVAAADTAHVDTAHGPIR